MARNLNRRSFLFRVAGGLLIAGAGAGQAQRPRRPAPRRMIVDADPNDPARPVRPTYQGVGRPRPPSHGDSDATDASGRPGPVPVQRFVVCPGNARCPRRLP